MARKRQTDMQIRAGKLYQHLKNTRQVIGSIKPNKNPKKGGTWYGFYIEEQSREERKITFKTMVENWFKTGLR